MLGGRFDLNFSRKLVGFAILREAFLEPIQELIESDESDVIPLRGA